MLRLTALCVLLCVAVVVVQAEDKNWSARNGQWSADTNWDPAGVPKADDDVYITNNGDYQVTLDVQATIKSLNLGGTSGQQTLLLQGAILSVSNGGTITESGVLDVASGTILGNGEILVSGLAKFHEFNTKSISTITLTILGNMTLDAGGIELIDSATIKIAETGQLYITSENGIVNSDKTDALIHNVGLITSAPGLPQNFKSTFSAAILNDGKLVVQSGTLAINNNGTWSKSLDVATGASVTVLSGNHTFTSASSITGNGTFSVQNNARVQLEGEVEIEQFEITNGDAIIVAQNADNGITFKHLTMLNGQLQGAAATIEYLDWQGGSMSIDTASIGWLQVSGSLARTVTGTKLYIRDLAVFANNTNILLYNSAALVISAGARMDINTQVFFLCGINDTSSTVQVEGLLYYNYTADIQVTCPLIVQETGVLQVEAGSLSIQSPFELFGNLSVTAGSQVDFSVGGPVHVGSSIYGQGYLSCQACNLAVEGYVDIGGIIFTGGSIVFQHDEGSQPYLPHIRFFNQSGSSVLQLTNNAETGLNLTIDSFEFTGGSIKSNLNDLFGVYSSLVISSSAKFYGGSPVLMQDLSYVNNGKTTFSGPQNAELTGRNIIVNGEDGIWEILGTVMFTQSDQDAGSTSQFINYGIFEVGLAATCTIQLNYYNYEGLSIREQASLTFQKAAFIQDKNDGAETVIFGGELTSASTPINILTGRLIGYGTITGDVLLKGILAATTEISGGSVPNDTPLRIQGSLVQRTPGILGVAVVSDENSTATLGGLLIIENTYQLWGGSLLIQNTSDPLAAPVDFIRYKNKVGVAGYDSIINANVNATYGFAIDIGSTSIQILQLESPAVVSISPSSGPTAGGTLVTVTGTKFVLTSLVVRIGDKEAPIAKLVGPNSVAITIPPGTGKGKAVCVLSDGRGCLASDANILWDYLPPNITSYTSTTKPTAGGNTVTIKGDNFGADASVASVMVGDYPCAITQITHTSIECTMPMGTGATNKVNVTIDGQEADFTYAYDVPSISSVNPTSIHTRGGERFILFGSNFGSNTDQITITIDTHPCTNVTLTNLEKHSDAAITCTTPALRAASAADVVVTVGGQKSAAAKVVVADGGGAAPTKAKSVWKKPVTYIIGGAVLIGGFIIGFALRAYLARRNQYERINAP